MPVSGVVVGKGGHLVADGVSFAIREWAHGPMDGPPLHVHHKDDEAWHVLDGTLTFRLGDRTVDADSGQTVFVPAGVAHTYGCSGDVRYLIVTTPRIFALIAELHTLADDEDPDAARPIYLKYESEVVEQ